MSTFILSTTALVLLAVLILFLPVWKPPGPGRYLAIILAVLVPLLTIVLYQEVGTPEGLNPQTAEPAAADGQHQMASAITALEEKLAQQPDNLEGLLLLGRSYRAMERYADAAKTFRRALAMDTENPAIQADLAEAITFAAGQPVFGEESMELLQRAVATDPQFQKGLWLLGIAHAQRGDNQQAVGYWQTLLSQLDPASEIAQTVSAQIQQLQPASQAPAPVPAVSPPIEDAAPQGIPVQVDLDTAFDSQLPGSATLYIFAHTPDGVGMPLAVQRVNQPQFPLQSAIADSNLLRPGNSLADFEQLKISARLSMSGNATPASGDIETQQVVHLQSDAGVIILLLDSIRP